MKFNKFYKFKRRDIIALVSFVVAVIGLVIGILSYDTSRRGIRKANTSMKLTKELDEQVY